ncbi:MAG: hypothetical protein IKS25_04525, partial [Oscillospiraceae bacterium]|nr:hypothetical protein [Oscillospiraceae bacterium]
MSRAWTSWAEGAYAKDRCALHSGLFSGIKAAALRFREENGGSIVQFSSSDGNGTVRASFDDSPQEAVDDLLLGFTLGQTQGHELD